MAKRLTADTRKMLLASATEETGRRGDRRLGTDHLLLGLLHHADSPAARALGVSLADARAALDALDLAALTAVGVRVAAVGEPPPPAFGRRLPPLTSGARAVLKRAIEEARPTRTGPIGTDHFLLALFSRERPDPAAELMHALGVDPETVRERLARSNRGEVA
jgi:ATP-dependent Clp protease ATP-binding subunit ClpA